MAAADTLKARSWVLYDEVVRRAAVGGFSNPWSRTSAGELTYSPDYETLTTLLGVALHLKAATTTGVPALALDVWVAYELRRAGFNPNAVWPRAENPRIVPTVIPALLDALPKAERESILKRLAGGSAIKGAVSSAAKVLGKNYVKQVDVVLSAWDTGPEILISTKRMDSSFGKNAANRVEESYGDAKNLRSRHPQAALGFVYGLRSTILTEQPDTAEWIIDLLTKLGREDDAYDAVALLMLDYSTDQPIAPDDPGDGENTLVEAGLAEEEPEPELPEVPVSEIEATLSSLPTVTLRHDTVPTQLSASVFFQTIVGHVLDNTPVTFHREARERRSGAAQESEISTAGIG